MAKTATVSVRVEPEVKAQVELVLSNLGMTLPGLFDVTMHQVLLRNGIPFEIKMPDVPTNINANGMTKTELDERLRQSYADASSGGRTYTIDEAFNKLVE